MSFAIIWDIETVPDLDGFGGVLGIEFAVDLSSRRNRSVQSATRETQKDIPMLGTIILVVLILLLFSALPTWPHRSSWGYAPSGILGTILIIMLDPLYSGSPLDIRLSSLTGTGLSG